MTALSPAAAASIAAFSTAANTRKFESISVVFGAIESISGLATEVKVAFPSNSHRFFVAVIGDPRGPYFYLEASQAMAEDVAGEMVSNMWEAAEI